MKRIDICSLWQQRKNLKLIIVKSENRTISSTQKMKCFLYCFHSSSHCLSVSVILLVTIAFSFFPLSSSSIPLLTGIHIYDASNLKEHTVSFCLRFTHSEQELCVCVHVYNVEVVIFFCIMGLNMWWKRNSPVMSMQWLSYTSNLWGSRVLFIFDHNSSVSKRWIIVSFVPLPFIPLYVDLSSSSVVS